MQIWSIFLLLWSVLAAKVSFKGHQVWESVVDSTEKIELFNHLESESLIDLWSSARKGPLLYSVSPQNKKKVKKLLKSKDVKRQVVFKDLQSLIRETEVPAVVRSKQQLLVPLSSGFFEKYQQIEQIQAHFDGLAKDYPALVKPFTIGKTYEGRDINGVIIRGLNSTSNGKNAIVFHGGIHAREWIGPATVSYIATELIENYGADPTITRLLDNFEFHIIPVLNVDGYIYSHSTNRMWRKNRQPNKFFCTGTDLNRNFDAGWSGPGASGNPCSDSYYGPAPFSAPESSAIAAYLKGLGDNLLVYMDIHAFSQLWMYPYGYDCKKVASNASEMKRIGDSISKAIKGVHGTSFAVGPICEIIYQASGASVDWALDALHLPVTYAVELRDTGKYGFLLPPKYIIPSGEEILAGVVAMGLELLK